MLGMIDKAREQIEKTINTALDKSEEFLERISNEENGSNLDLRFLSDGLASLNSSINEVQKKVSNQLNDTLEKFSSDTDKKIETLEKRIKDLETKLKNSSSAAPKLNIKEVTLDDLKINSYNDLGVRKIFAAMETLEVVDLEKIKIYEKNNKNRVTIIRAADRLIEDKNS